MAFQIAIAISDGWQYRYARVENIATNGVVRLLFMINHFIDSLVKSYAFEENDSLQSYLMCCGFIAKGVLVLQ